MSHESILVSSSGHAFANPSAASKEECHGSYALDMTEQHVLWHSQGLSNRTHRQALGHTHLAPVVGCASPTNIIDISTLCVKPGYFTATDQCARWKL